MPAATICPGDGRNSGEITPVVVARCQASRKRGDRGQHGQSALAGCGAGRRRLHTARPLPRAGRCTDAARPSCFGMKLVFSHFATSGSSGSSCCRTATAPETASARCAASCAPASPWCRNIWRLHGRQHLLGRLAEVVCRGLRCVLWIGDSVVGALQHADRKLRA